MVKCPRRKKKKKKKQEKKIPVSDKEPRGGEIKKHCVGGDTQLFSQIKGKEPYLPEGEKQKPRISKATIKRSKKNLKDHHRQWKKSTTRQRNDEETGQLRIFCREFCQQKQSGVSLGKATKITAE